MDEKIIAKLKQMLDEADKKVKHMAAGFDEGFYCGKFNWLEGFFIPLK